MISLLFTDVENSTHLAARAPAEYDWVIARHFEILRRCLAKHGGREFLENGDGIMLAFSRAANAAAFAIEAQQLLSREEWPAETGALKVRMALHTGKMEFRDGQYRGLAMNLATRLLAAAHGGQVVCSEEAVRALEDFSLAPLRAMGVFRLRGFERAEKISELLWQGDLEFRQLRAEYARSHNLPVMQMPIVGRGLERAMLKTLLDPEKGEARLVTLSGPGGIGKTRLAIEAARDLLEVFNHAVALVSLADLEEPGHIAGAVRYALRIPAKPPLTALDQLRDAFGVSPVLLVLDNLEQLLPEGAARVQGLLRQIPGLRCLVTSRIALALPGERVFPVAPLATPAQAPSSSSLSASGELFIQCARAIRPEFQLTGANRPALIHLCNLLEGVPLAIELAAARISVLSPHQILAQIEDRFTLLHDQHNQHPQRHSSLEAAISWSFNALPKKSREVLASLSVFMGGFVLDAATQVAGEGAPEETEAALQNLRFCSLLTVEDGAEGLRFRLLETIRRYASDQLGGLREAVQERHWKYFSTLAYDVEVRLRDELNASRLDRLEEEQPNFVQALANASSPIRRLRLATALHQFWLLRGYARENRRWFNPSAHCDDRRERSIVARAFHAAGVLDLSLGRLWRARVSFERSQLLFEEIGMERNIASAVHNLGQIAFWQGNHKLAQRHYLHCLTIFERLGETSQLAATLAMLGVCYMEEGDFQAARPPLKRSLQLLKSSNDRTSYALALKNFGYLEFRCGDLATAREHYSESLSIHRELNIVSNIPDLYVSLAQFADSLGQFEMSARLLASAVLVRRQLAQQLSKRLEKLVLDLKENARGALGERAFNRIVEEIEPLGLNEIVNIPIDLD